ncbi:MAG: Bifunctional NAD(P)H-hydrate repair enzyme Nnr [bacterium ADurb.Bin429]|nr:MAG: Bifunctional NAD(P)H-hydrate repair enzyme Nnr [bacterium ADurb.Bin429]
MKLVTAEQMRALDRYAIEELGIPGLTLMERAGEAVASETARLLDAYPGMVLVLCGKGNNGGPDARANYDRAVEARVTILSEVTDADLREAGVIVDALLGTGVSGAVRGELASLIERVNALRAGCGVLAVDVPSGVETNTGQVPGTAMRAELTVTMGLPKPCLLLYPAAEFAGEWAVADIGFPPEVVDGWNAVAEMTELEQVSEWVPARRPTAHKMDVGAVLVIAGSFGMTGAAAMAATAAYRAGAGLVRLALPASLTAALNAQLTEVVFRPMSETRAGTLSFHGFQRLLDEVEGTRAVLLGPGLSRHPATAHLIRRLVPLIHAPLVVDADALTAMVGHDRLWRQREKPTVITPHPGEMSRLLGQPATVLEEDRIAAAKEAARRFNATVVFKGSPVVIAAPDGRTFVNPTGTPALAVVGTGDVLAGMIAALIAQRVEVAHAAALACFTGGLAAQRMTAQLGLRGFTALDLIAAIPHGLAEVAGE